MKNTMAHYFKVVAPYLDASLVSENASSSICQLTQSLPYFPISGIECRLGKQKDRVDFQGNIDTYTQDFASYFQTIPDLNYLHSFCQEWSQPDSFLQKIVHDLWLEFDVYNQAQESFNPCIFIAINNDLQPTIDSLEACISLLSNSLDENLPIQTIKNFKSCYSLLPEEAEITHLGLMSSRAVKTIRVNLKGIPIQGLGKYLQRIGWPGQCHHFESIVHDIAGYIDHHTITLDIGETISPRIGMECFFNQQPSLEPRWFAFLDSLVERGICTPQKRDALLAWPGMTQKSEQPEAWPEDLYWNDLLLGSDAYSLFWRSISLIKIVYQAHRPLSAKGYLAFGHRWFPIDPSPQPAQEDAYRQSAFEPRERLETSHSQYLAQVQNYYDKMNPLYLRYVGHTYQAGLLTPDEAHQSYANSNLFCAHRAGIQPGQIILDAGCGICGPSIDIAKGIADVQICAVTISEKQVETAKELLSRKKLSSRIKISQGDFHELTYSDRTFDHVMFLESAGYSYNQHRLISEAYRVLKPGGSLYIKDVFCKSTILSHTEKKDLEIFNQIYVYKTSTVDQLLAVIADIGFQDLSSCDLTHLSDTTLFNKAMISIQAGYLEKTEFGKYHHYDFTDLPIIFGEIKASKPVE